MIYEIGKKEVQNKKNLNNKKHGFNDKMEEFDYLLKICLFGDKDVGKKTFASNIFHRHLDEYLSLGVEFFTKDITVNRGSNARLQLWLRPNENRFDENQHSVIQT